MSRWLFVIVLSVVTLGAAQRPFLNLDFETANRGLPWGWMTAAPAGYLVSADTGVVFSGAQSLRIVNNGAASTATAAAYQHLPIDLIRGKHIQLSGYIKTSGISGYAGYWMRVVGRSGERLGFNDMSGTGPGGSTDWQRYSFDLDVSAEAEATLFGALQTGDETSWFDHLAITIDGVPYRGVPNPNA